MLRQIFAFIFLITIFGALRADEPDATKAKVDTARAAYETAMKKFREEAAEFFEQQEKAARERGSLKEVDQVQADRKTFEQTGTLPKTAPMTLKKKPAAAAATLATAYDLAIKEYVKVKKDDEARLLMKQLENLKALGGAGPVGPLQKMLFNGKDLKGWVIDGGTANQWKVVRGEIIGASPSWKTRSYLLTNSNYSNFILSLEFKAGEKDMSAGVVIRGVVNEKMPSQNGGPIFDHPLIKLTGDSHAEKEPTGTSHWVMDAGMYTLPRAKTELQQGGWNTLNVTVDGKKSKLEVNAKVICEVALADDVKGTFVPGLGQREGRIGLQINTGEIRLRNIQVQSLTEKREDK